MTQLKPLIAGNWKMNGTRDGLAELSAMAAGYGPELKEKADLALCPPATLLSLAAEITAPVGIGLGGQDCHWNASGAHTGDVSAAMLRDIGADRVIVGHSERRADHGETDAVVLKKTEAALGAGLIAIVCVGETEAERDAGQTIQVVSDQLAGSVPDGATPANAVIAYEPVWAIGTGRTPTTDDVAAVHGAIRQRLLDRFGSSANGFRLLYGGSVKPSNAGSLMSVANVNGALVGGASLKAADFLAIAAACP